MKPTTIFIFGLINFVILVTALIWGTRRASRQFFYARRTVIKKDMVSSASLLKDAKARFSKLKNIMSTLADDILARRKAKAARAKAECDEILNNAKQKAAGLLEAASRQAEEARKDAVFEVKSRILEEAFARAGASLLKGMPEKAKKDAVERGLKEVSAIVNSSAGASMLKGEVL